MIPAEEDTHPHCENHSWHRECRQLYLCDVVNDWRFWFPRRPPIFNEWEYVKEPMHRDDMGETIMNHPGRTLRLDASNSAIRGEAVIITVTFEAEGHSQAIEVPCDVLPEYLTRPFIINAKENTVEDLLDWTRAKVLKGDVEIKGDI